MEDLQILIRQIAGETAERVVTRLLEDKRLPSVQNKWLTAEQACQYTGFSYRNLMGCVRAGTGPEHSLKGDRTYRFHVDALDAWMRSEGPARGPGGEHAR